VAGLLPLLLIVRSLIHLICSQISPFDPIPQQGSLSVLDPHVFTPMKASGKEKGASAYHCCGACSIVFYNLRNS
jgi:hypothetical protein